MEGEWTKGWLRERQEPDKGRDKGRGWLEVGGKGEEEGEISECQERRDLRK